jgi:2-iminobutanoate/2-iminopropanoate deaminase
MHKRISTNSFWENAFGFSRAVDTGDTLYISKTGPQTESGEIPLQDTYDQTNRCLKKIDKVLYEAGYKKEDVIYSKMYLTSMDNWEEAGKAHGEFYNEIRPAFSLIQVNDFPDKEMIVAIETIAKKISQ